MSTSTSPTGMEVVVGGKGDLTFKNSSPIKFFGLHTEVTLLDDGGNGINVCVLAVVAALRHFQLPEVDFGGDIGDGVVEDLGNGNTNSVSIIHSDDWERLERLKGWNINGVGTLQVKEGALVENGTVMEDNDNNHTNHEDAKNEEQY